MLSSSVLSTSYQPLKLISSMSLVIAPLVVSLSSASLVNTRLPSFAVISSSVLSTWYQPLKPNLFLCFFYWSVFFVAILHCLSSSLLLRLEFFYVNMVSLFLYAFYETVFSCNIPLLNFKGKEKFSLRVS